jgi:hypothetical protein
MPRTTTRRNRRSSTIDSINMDKFREMVTNGYNKAEIRKEFNLASNAMVDAVQLKLCRLDNKIYPEIPGGRINNEVKVNSQESIVLSKTKLAKYDWIQPDSKFKITSDGKTIKLTLIEPSPQIEE